MSTDYPRWPSRLFSRAHPGASISCARAGLPASTLRATVHFFSLTLACLLALGCRPSPSASETPSESTPAAQTRWLRAEPASKVAWLDAPARALASPESALAVSVPMSARVLRVHVRPGQTVSRDDALVDVLLPELLKAAGALSAAGLRVRAYETRKARLTTLVEQGLSRAGELSDVEVNLALAEAEREAARATLRVAGVNEAQAAKLLSERGTVTLRAVAPAMVVRVSARPGEIREPAGGALLELVTQGSVQIEARFAYAPPEGAQFSWLSQGATSPLVLDAVSPVAAPEDGSRVLWLHAQDPAQAPVPGSLGRVRLIAKPDWLVLPVKAVRQSNAGSSVLLREVEAREQGKEMPVTVVLRSNSELIVRGIPSDSQVAADATGEP